MSDILISGISELLTLEGVAQKDGRRVVESDLGSIKKAVLAIRAGKILWVGAQSKFNSSLRKSLGFKKFKEIDMEGRQVMPALHECHTHSVFAGDRSADFEMRNQGVSYQEIGRKGGGILSTVRATRAASAAKLLSLTQARVDEFVRQGVTSVEIKSGYGLDAKSEIKILEVAGRVTGPRVIRTFLGPHSVPPEFSDSESYLTFLINDVLPQVARRKLAERADIFVEGGYFSVEQGRRWFKAAKQHGLVPVGHVDQLSFLDGAGFAIEMGAVSADHVVQITESAIKKLAGSATTAVLLPTSDFYLKMKYPPARALIDAGARVALASDFNPGTSPTQDISLVGLLARLEMKMTLAETISAYTYGAAQALGKGDKLGSLEKNKLADFIVLKENWRELFYQVGRHPVAEVYREGRKIN